MQISVKFVSRDPIDNKLALAGSGNDMPRHCKTYQSLDIYHYKISRTSKITVTKPSLKPSLVQSKSITFLQCRH